MPTKKAAAESSTTDIDAPLREFLTNRLPPSASSVQPLHRETTICFAYMCQYAYGCTEKSDRQAQVLTRRCMRYQPESMRIKPGLSEHALDLLARYRDKGAELATSTLTILEHLRPDGPMRKTP